MSTRFLRSSSVSRENSGICFFGSYLWTRSQFLTWFRWGKFISYYFWQDYLSQWGADICGEGGRASYSREKYSASVDNTLLDLLNSSYPTQPHSLTANYLTLWLILANLSADTHSWQVGNQVLLATTDLEIYVLYLRTSQSKIAQI